MSNVIGFYHEQKVYGCFSNFYRCSFTVDGKDFNCSEHYFMYQKALLFDPNGEEIKMMTVDKSPSRLKKLGRSVKNFDEKKWNDVCEEVMYRGCFEKFFQNENLKHILLSTGTAILAECSPIDRIWGIGLSVDNPNIHNPEKWQGKNLLGKVLMRVREELYDTIKCPSL
jgi:ribA/ribD-fused uncharacterized protein